MGDGPLNVRAEVLSLLACGWEPLSYACHRGSPELTGRIDHADWAKAPWTSDFIDIEGDRRPKPRYRTRAKMLWDNRYFYVAAEMEEPNVWATLTEHDSVIFHDNDFEVFMDPEGANARYFEFEINALNTTWDLYLPKAYRDGGSAQNEWESDALSKVSVRGTLNEPGDKDDGWSVEIAFPWEKMRPAKLGDTWRVNFSRVEWDVHPRTCKKIEGRAEHNWVWTQQGVIDMHQPEMWGRVTFVD